MPSQRKVNIVIERKPDMKLNFDKLFNFDKSEQNYTSMPT